MVYDKKNFKIFIIDDDENVLRLLEAMLLKMGFHNIIKSKSSEEAIRLTKEGPPDLFFIDIMMPEMAGNEFRELLKEKSTTKNIPVIFISGIISEMEEKAMGGRLISGDIIVAKPFTIKRIAEAIAEILNKIS